MLVPGFKMRGGVQPVDAANLIAAIILHFLGRVLRQRPIGVTIWTYPLLAPIAMRNVHITQPSEFRAWGGRRGALIYGQYLRSRGRLAAVAKERCKAFPGAELEGG